MEQRIDGGAEPGLAAGFYRCDERAEVEVRFAAAMERRQIEPHFSAAHREHSDSHRIVLAHRDIRERRRDREGETELVVVLRKSHRCARIDQHRDLHLALGAKGADREFVEACVGVPVQKAEVVALVVFAEVLGFDSEALQAADGALAGADGPRPLDPEDQPVELLDEFGLERARLEHRINLRSAPTREPT